VSIGEIIVTIFILFAAPAVATAGEQTIIRDAQGRTTGTASPQGDGTVKFRDSSGRVIGSATTDPGGQTRYYDESGRSLGTSTGPMRPMFSEKR
jgi:hypothetical protein